MAGDSVQGKRDAGGTNDRDSVSHSGSIALLAIGKTLTVPHISNPASILQTISQELRGGRLLGGKSALRRPEQGI